MLRFAAHDRPRVLMLTHRVPYPLDRGDRIRAFHMLRTLAPHCDVALASMSQEPLTPEQRDVLASLTERCAVRRIDPRWSRLRGLAALATGGAITPACFFRRDLRRTLEQWQRERPFDAVLTYCSGMIRYARGLAPAARHVLDLVDVDSAKWAQYARQGRGPMRWVYAAEARRLRRIEAGGKDHLDAVAVVSDAEAAVYRQTVGDHPRLTVLRHSIDADYFAPAPQAQTMNLLFTGVLNYHPNVQGVLWFAREVLPLLRSRCGGSLRFQIVGREPCAEVLALSGVPGVEVVGSVPDVRPYLRRAAVVVAPLRIARGVQTKVLEAMASARVAVCSFGAAQGILATPGEHLFACDSPRHWAEQIELALGNVAMRARVGRLARERIESHYRWQSCYAPLLELVTGQSRHRAELRRAA